MKEIYLIFLAITVYNSVGWSNDPVKVYKSFDQIEGYLKPQGDTTLVVNFWASWCRPCVEEMPVIEQVRQEMKNEKLKFLLISLDDASDLEKSVAPLIDRLKITSKVIILDDTDYNSWIDKVDNSWSGAIPATLFVNKNSRKLVEKSFKYEELKETINKLKLK